MSVPKAVLEQLEHCVDVATHDLLKECDWKTNFLIVEMINKNLALIPHAIRLVKGRLGNRKPHIRTLSVQLLHMIIANCPGSRPHVAESDFMKFLIHTLPKAIRKPKKKYLFGGAMPQDVVELSYADLTLLLMKKWAADYHKDGRSLQFVISYKKLLADGCVFPDPLTVELYEQTIISPDQRPNDGITTEELMEYHRKEYNEKVHGIKHDISTKNPRNPSNVEIADYNKPDKLTPLQQKEAYEQDAQLMKVTTEILFFPDQTAIRFKDSKRAIEVAAMLIDLINAYSPLLMNNPNGRLRGHPRNDGQVQDLFEELASLLDAVRIAVDSGQIQEEFKVKELLLVHDTLTNANKYYKDIISLKKIPGQVIRSGQEAILQSYLAHQQQLQQEQAALRLKQQQQQQQAQQNANAGKMLGPGLDNSRPLSTQYVDQYGNSTNMRGGNINMPIDGIVPAVIIPNQTVVAQPGKIQPLVVVQKYDNANDIRSGADRGSSSGMTGRSGTGGAGGTINHAGRTGSATGGFKPAQTESFESAAFANSIQSPHTMQQGHHHQGNGGFKPAQTESFESAAFANSTQSPTTQVQRGPQGQQSRQQSAQQQLTTPVIGGQNNPQNQQNFNQNQGQNQQNFNQNQQNNQQQQQQHSQNRIGSNTGGNSGGYTPQLGSVPTLGQTTGGTRGGRGQNTQGNQQNQQNQQNQGQNRNTSANNANIGQSLAKDLDFLSFVNDEPKNQQNQGQNGQNQGQNQQQQQQNRQNQQQNQQSNSLDLLMSLYDSPNNNNQHNQQGFNQNQGQNQQNFNNNNQNQNFNNQNQQNQQNQQNFNNGQQNFNNQNQQNFNNGQQNQQNYHNNINGQQQQQQGFNQQQNYQNNQYNMNNIQQTQQNFNQNYQNQPQNQQNQQNFNQNQQYNNQNQPQQQQQQQQRQPQQQQQGQNQQQQQQQQKGSNFDPFDFDF